MFIGCGESTLGAGGMSLRIMSNPAADDAIAIFSMITNGHVRLD